MIACLVGYFISVISQSTPEDMAHEKAMYKLKEKVQMELIAKGASPIQIRCLTTESRIEFESETCQNAALSVSNSKAMYGCNN